MKYLTVVKNDQESKKVEEKIREKIKLEYSKESPDYVIAIGGDGTIIQASHSYPNAIIFGVHTGHLGFYANYDVDKLDELINDINSNTFETLDIEYISCEVIDKNNNVLLLGEALNEVTILTPLRTLILDVNIDGKHFETFRGTGLCVSTTFVSSSIFFFSLFISFSFWIFSFFLFLEWPNPIFLINLIFILDSIFISNF